MEKHCVGRLIDVDTLLGGQMNGLSGRTHTHARAHIFTFTHTHTHIRAHTRTHSHTHTHTLRYNIFVISLFTLMRQVAHFSIRPSATVACVCVGVCVGGGGVRVRKRDT